MSSAPPPPPPPLPPYTPPAWSAAPAQAARLETLRSGVSLGEQTLPAAVTLLGRAAEEAAASVPGGAASLPQEHESVSRVHAVLQYGDGSLLYLADLGSTHGTTLNRRRLEPHSYKLLHDGDVIQLGASSRLFVVLGAAAAPAAAAPAAPPPPPPPPLLPRPVGWWGTLADGLADILTGGDGGILFTAAATLSRLSWVDALALVPRPGAVVVNERERTLVERLRASAAKLRGFALQAERIAAGGAPGGGGGKQQLKLSRASSFAAPGAVALSDGQRLALARLETSMEKALAAIDVDETALRERATARGLLDTETLRALDAEDAAGMAAGTGGVFALRGGGGGGSLRVGAGRDDLCFSDDDAGALRGADAPPAAVVAAAARPGGGLRIVRASAQRPAAAVGPAAAAAPLVGAKRARPGGNDGVGDEEEEEEDVDGGHTHTLESLTLDLARAQNAVDELAASIAVMRREAAALGGGGGGEDELDAYLAATDRVLQGQRLAAEQRAHGRALRRQARIEAMLAAVSAVAPLDSEALHVAPRAPSEAAPALAPSSRLSALACPQVAGLARFRHLALFLDYDGTLAPSEGPSRERRPPPAVLAALRAIAAAAAAAAAVATPASPPSLLASIVTGRSHANLIDVLSPEPAAAAFVLACSHGLDIRGGGGGGRVPDLATGAGELPALRAALGFARSQLASRGLRCAINDEGYFFSFQLADAPPAEAAAAAQLAADAADAAGAAAGLWLGRGRDVIEVRIDAARRWAKGEAVRHILQEAGLAGRADVALLAIGDDEPDEAMFEAVRGAGCGAAVAVRVRGGVRRGNDETAATHELQTVEEVGALLLRLAEARARAPL